MNGRVAGRSSIRSHLPAESCVRLPMLGVALRFGHLARTDRSIQDECKEEQSGSKMSGGLGGEARLLYLLALERGKLIYYICWPWISWFNRLDIKFPPSAPQHPPQHPGAPAPQLPQLKLHPSMLDSVLTRVPILVGCAALRVLWDVPLQHDVLSTKHAPMTVAAIL